MGAVNSARASDSWGLPDLAVALVMIAAVFGCSFYANLSDLVINPEHYRYFPPFKPSVNCNDNGHLGAEYFNIARSIVKGEGFANPFGIPTGPTAWMPPVLPVIEAALLWALSGDKSAVKDAVVFLQGLTLAGTGLLVLALLRKTAGGRLLWAGLLVFLLVGLVGHFSLAFQNTHDCWLVLLVLDLLVSWLSWGRPLASRGMALGWGAFGGLSALVSPVLGMVWGMLSLAMGWRQHAWARLALALGMVAMVILPWTVRNYLVFGRLIPIKSNLAFELYQSQVLEPDGVLRSSTWARHPYCGGAAERAAYRALGEMVYMDRKMEKFREAVRAEPLGFLQRVGARFLAATLVYWPVDRAEEGDRPWTWWHCRLTHPLPFLSVVFLLLTARWLPLSPIVWSVMAVYLLYMAPYVVVGYYDRYAFPLLGLKTLLVLWASSQSAALIACVVRAR